MTTENAASLSDATGAALAYFRGIFSPPPAFGMGLAEAASGQGQKW
jgi:hypothetical protein